MMMIMLGVVLDGETVSWTELSVYTLKPYAILHAPAAERISVSLTSAWEVVTAGLRAHANGTLLY